MDAHCSDRERAKYCTSETNLSRSQPANLFFIALLSMFALIFQVQAGERSAGSSDTSRRTSSGHRHPTEEQRHFSGGSADATLQEQVDPAVRQFWSDRCVNQRASGRSHSGDCNHPAYSGAGYGWVDPYRYPEYRPVYPGANTVIINRGGTVVVPQQYGGRLSTGGRLVPLPGR